MSTATLNCTQAAYIAGIVDGEGTITLTRLHRGEQRRLVVSVSNNERPLLEFLRESIGAGRITNKRTYSATHAPSFTYQITSRQALDLLRQIEPYLQTYKATRARMALEKYVTLTPRNGKYGERMRIARAAFERDFLAVSLRNSGVRVTNPRDGIITIPSRQDEYNSDELIGAINAGNLHAEISFGKPVGKEAL